MGILYLTNQDLFKSQSAIGPSNEGVNEPGVLIQVLKISSKTVRFEVPGFIEGGPLPVISRVIPPCIGALYSPSETHSFWATEKGATHVTTHLVHDRLGGPSCGVVNFSEGPCMGMQIL